MNIQNLRKSDKLYSRYRIPGMMVTSKGTLLAWCEARQQSDDWSMMDILLQRSTDGGKTFDSPCVMAHGTPRHPTVNNPVAVEDKNGHLHFLWCEDYGIHNGRILHAVSTDDGLSWEAPTDITYATLPEWRNAFALGPGHGICTSSGTLLFPVWMVPKSAGVGETDHSPSVAAVLFSRDNGKSWDMTPPLSHQAGIESPSEAELALTENGTVCMNIRLGWGAFCRGQAFSRTGFSAWSAICAVPSLTDPCCFGSVVSGTGADGVFRMYYCGCRSAEERNNVTVWVSEDSGMTWRIGACVDALRGGYVESALSRDGKLLYILYEDRYGETNHLATVSLPGHPNPDIVPLTEGQS